MVSLSLKLFPAIVLVTLQITIRSCAIILTQPTQLTSNTFDYVIVGGICKLPLFPLLGANPSKSWTCWTCIGKPFDRGRQYYRPCFRGRRKVRIQVRLPISTHSSHLAMLVFLTWRFLFWRKGSPQVKNNLNPVHTAAHSYDDDEIDTNLDWNYTVTPQAGLNNRTFTYPRGRVLGGGTSVSK